MKYLPTKVIEKKALELLEAAIELDSPPINLEAIADYLNIKIKLDLLGEDVSGLIIIESDGATIGINENHAEVRQRFTLAHEIGHFMLHKNASELFIDKKYNAIYRDSRSSVGEDRAEIQANQFAAALLMPEPLLKKVMQTCEFDLGDDTFLTKLATSFKVSPQALAYRLSNLRIFPPN